MSVELTDQWIFKDWKRGRRYRNLIEEKLSPEVLWYTDQSLLKRNGRQETISIPIISIPPWNACIMDLWGTLSIDLSGLVLGALVPWGLTHFESQWDTDALDQLTCLCWENLQSHSVYSTFWTSLCSTSSLCPHCLHPYLTWSYGSSLLTGLTPVLASILQATVRVNLNMQLWPYHDTASNCSSASHSTPDKVQAPSVQVFGEHQRQHSRYTINGSCCRQGQPGYWLG